MPCDDSLAESPHASLKREAGRTRGSKFSWHAATMRLGWNLANVWPLASDSCQVLQACWNKCPSALLSRRSPNQRAKISAKKCYPRIYDITSHDLLDNERTAQPKKSAGRNAAIEDGSAVDEAAIAFVAGQPEAQVALRRASTDELLAVDLAIGFIDQLAFFSLPLAPGETEDPEFAVENWRVYQLLSKTTRDVLVPTAMQKASSSREWLLLRIEVYAAPGAAWTASHTPQKLQCFTMDEPQYLDAFELLAAVLPKRSQWRVWTPASGGGDGQLELVNPQPFEWRTALGSDWLSGSCFQEQLSEYSFQTFSICSAFSVFSRGSQICERIRACSPFACQEAAP